MTMLAKTESRALSLADYEARIHLYKEQIGTGYIGIGSIWIPKYCVIAKCLSYPGTGQRNLTFS